MLDNEMKYLIGGYVKRKRNNLVKDKVDSFMSFLDGLISEIKEGTFDKSPDMKALAKSLCKKTYEFKEAMYGKFGENGIDGGRSEENL